MGTEPDADGDSDPRYDWESLSRGQRLLLYFDKPRRRFWAGAAFVATWFLLSVLTADHEHLAIRIIPIVFLYGFGFALWILFTHGSGLNRPAPLPEAIMRDDARNRFSDEEIWESPIPPDAALAALKTLFNQSGVEAEAIGPSLWVRLGKEWKAAEWWHRAAAPDIRRPPAVQFFVTAADGGSRVTAYSVDRRLFGLYDVVKLSDEMSATAVKLARNVTGATAPPKGPRN